MKKNAFSLIEVVFASAFLIMVGVAMMALNNAASRLIATAELKMTAEGFNEQAINYLALTKRTATLNTNPFILASTVDCALQTCYVVCDPLDLSTSCALKSESEGVRVSTSKNTFTTEVVISSLASSKYLVVAKTSWGNGLNRQLKGARILE